MNQSSFPILTTTRLTLRQLSIDDSEAVLALRSDPAINKYLDRPLSSNTEDAINFINKVNENIEKNIAFYWAITLTETKTFVGTICLYDFAEKNSCEIGYELLPEFQRLGIMQEAVQIVVDFAFDILKLKKILAFTHHANQASSNLLEKFNFIKSTERDKENPKLFIFTLTK